MKLLYFSGFLSIILFLSTLNQVAAQVSFEWAEAEGGSLADGGMDVTTDELGNSYVTGYFSGTVVFGTISLTSQGDQDIFIAKYNSDGEVLWAKSAGAAEGADSGESIAIDDAGNVYITGKFHGIATFGNIEIESHSITFDGIEYFYGDDIFVAKYSSAGTFLWVRSAGGDYNDSGTGIDVDALGNAYVAGFYDTEADFSHINLSPSAGQHAFVAKYNTSGTVQWAKSSTGDNYEQGNDLAVDDLGNSYITGHFVGHAFFDANPITSTGEIFPGDPAVYYYNEDIFVAKFSPTGTNLWAKSAGGTGYDRGYGIDIDDTGNSYFTGVYSGTAVFAPNLIVTSTYDPVFEYFSDDIFIAQYNTAGTPQWVQSAGGTGPEAGIGITSDAAGNSAITGFFSGIATFGTNQLTSTADAGNFYTNDIFLARYSSAGTYNWAVKAGGQGDDRGQGVSLSTPSNFFLTGYYYEPSATFGTAGTLPSSGFDDIFLAHLNDPAITLPVQLIAFHAVKNDNSAILTWSTASEDNCEGFEIEVSTTNSGFIKLGSLASKNGNSRSVQNYRFTDSDITSSGTRYYRLTQTDTDGKKNYLGIRAVRFDFVGTTTVSAGPNPFTQSFEVFIESETEQIGMAILTDALGRTISTSPVKLSKGANNFRPDQLENLRSGIYFFTLQCPEKSFTLRMIKQ